MVLWTRQQTWGKAGPLGLLGAAEGDVILTFDFAALQELHVEDLQAVSFGVPRVVPTEWCEAAQVSNFEVIPVASFMYGGGCAEVKG